MSERTMSCLVVVMYMEWALWFEYRGRCQFKGSGKQKKKIGDNFRWFGFLLVVIGSFLPYIHQKNNNSSIFQYLLEKNVFICTIWFGLLSIIAILFASGFHVLAEVYAIDGMILLLLFTFLGEGNDVFQSDLFRVYQYCFEIGFWCTVLGFLLIVRPLLVQILQLFLKNINLFMRSTRQVIQNLQSLTKQKIPRN